MVKNINHNVLEKSNRTINDALNVRINCLLSTERSNFAKVPLKGSKSFSSKVI